MKYTQNPSQIEKNTHFTGLQKSSTFLNFIILKRFLVFEMPFYDFKNSFRKLEIDP